jgi:hypothetical protein
VGFNDRRVASSKTTQRTETADQMGGYAWRGSKGLPFWRRVSVWVSFIYVQGSPYMAMGC